MPCYTSITVEEDSESQKSASVSCMNGNIENQDFTQSQDATDKIAHHIRQPDTAKMHEKQKLWDLLATGSDKDTVCVFFF